MIRIMVPVVVEGRYDKAKLAGIIDGTIVTTEGFGIFNNAEKRELLRKIGANGLIILCDSDGGGTVIRSGLKGMLEGIRTYDLYIPQVPGKEKRKRKNSKEGYLGVEGIGNDVIIRAFEALLKKHPELGPDRQEDTVATDAGKDKTIDTAFLYEAGLNGTEGAAARRDDVCRKLGLPSGMSAGAFCEIAEIVSSREEILGLTGMTETHG